ncbi:hypothetical protein GGF38_001987 [Coemansia sp. RSA 25]|nr:hypothetical protein GGF38_001987 [Coemansia sp. RSA 25]
MSSSDNKLCLDNIDGLFPIRAFFGTCVAEPKTRVELRMLKASASIRLAPEWAEQLNDEDKCQVWAAQVKNNFELTDGEVEYVFEELKYYALLKENSNNGDEPGSIDSMWVTSAANDSELAEEFKCNAKALESDFVQDAPSAGCQTLVDPFLYPFSGDESLLLASPVATPEAALDLSLPRTKPGSPDDWLIAIKNYNTALSAVDSAFDKREISELFRACFAVELGEEYVSWLPTDFHVRDDGSIDIRSYINNLHPVRYAALYQSISKVFAKFVPLLEQVITDIIHPRELRVDFIRHLCVKPGMLDPEQVRDMVYNEEEIPKEYQKYIVPYRPKYGETMGNDAEETVHLDIKALYDDYEESEIYTEPAPSLFSPADRPLKPYSMRGLPLQASVEMASFYLTPENPVLPEGEWQAVARSEERIFAVGLYFYDVENIASPKLKFRDPVASHTFSHANGLKDFCRSHVVELEHEDEHCTYEHFKYLYTQEVGEVDIKSGSYICYPNFYQTKMTSLKLEDPTRSGHLKYIGFYIVEPTRRLVSTEIAPPQQPGWTFDVASVVKGIDGLSLADTNSLGEEESESDAIERAERLQRQHAKCNRDVMNRFSVYMINDYDD